ncbi:hypothetical protein J5N97_015362 [Dioscorea zingiberensis]|uniref:Peroxisomal membrane protein 11A n=1 Tax=Dioscorea zingiberensis TaxID=325984 RepID=A0A9D5CV71_9LILI|nr:hypothetical protein J5N97_015362 [Dioscorea zingiberensis]
MDSGDPKPSLATSRDNRRDRDFLLHLEAYLARRDGVDKLLKISRYAAKIALAAGTVPPTLAPRLKSFEASVGLSRKAFRLGKFVQDVNALRSSTGDPFLAAVAYGGEGIYYFIEQLVWLSKAGLINPRHASRLQKISAWAELIGYIGSIALKLKEIKNINFVLESKAQNDQEIHKLREKLVLKQLSVVQDIADGLMALGDVRDGKGWFSDPLLMASAGMLSALISTHKNWNSC